jgi:hypothetical protein
MTSPAFRVVGASNTASANNINLTADPTIQNNDILAARLYVEPAGLAMNTLPSGYTLKRRLDATQFSVYEIWKRTNGTESAVTFGATGATFMAGEIAAYSGCVTSGDPYDVIGTGNTGTNATATAGSITPSVTDTLIVYLETNFDAFTATPPSGMTERYDALFYSADLAQASSAATGSKAATLTGSSEYVAVLAALKSPTSAAPSIDPLTVAGKCSVTAALTTGVSLVAAAGGETAGAAALSTSSLVAVTAAARGSITAALTTGARFVVDLAVRSAAVATLAVASFPTTSVLDPFDRADANPLDGNWATFASYAPLELLGTAVRTQGAVDQGSAMYYTGGPYGPDAEVFITMNARPSVAGSFGIFLGVTNPTSDNYTGYFFEYIYDPAGTDQLTIYRKDSAGISDFQVLFTTGLEFNVGDKFGAARNGTSVRFLRYDGATWSPIGAAIDTNYTTPGYLALYADRGAFTFDFFGGGTSTASTNSIQADAAAVATLSVALSTTIRPATDAASKAAITAALTSGIPLAAAAQAKVSATSTLAALLNAVPAAKATVAGVLTTATAANASAYARAGALAAPTNFATVVLIAPLYVGQGGILDPDLWPTTQPAVGSTIYYDPTHIIVYPNGEISSDVADSESVVQFFDGTQWQIATVVFTSGLAARIVVEPAASAALTSAIPIAAQIYSRVSTTAALSVAAVFAVDAAARTSITAPLSTAVRLAANAYGQAQVTVAFDIGAGFAVSAISESALAADLTTALQLAAAAMGRASVTSALTTGLRMVVDARGIATVSADIAGGSLLSTLAAARAVLNADLTVPSAAYAVDAAAKATAQASLTTAILPAAGAFARALVDANLFSSPAIFANGVGRVYVAAALTTGVQLAAQVSGTSAAVAAAVTAVNLVAAGYGEGFMSVAPMTVPPILAKVTIRIRTDRSEIQIRTAEI